MFNEGLRWLAERQNKNPIFGATYSAGLARKLETCHFQALNVMKVPCCLRAPGPLCSSPSAGAAVPESSKWGKVQSRARCAGSLPPNAIQLPPQQSCIAIAAPEPLY